MSLFDERVPPWPAYDGAGSFRIPGAGISVAPEVAATPEVYSTVQRPSEDDLAAAAAAAGQGGPPTMYPEQLAVQSGNFGYGPSCAKTT
jgi:hypothetical protein